MAIMSGRLRRKFVDATPQICELTRSNDRRRSCRSMIRPDCAIRSSHVHERRTSLGSGECCDPRRSAIRLRFTVEQVTARSSRTGNRTARSSAERNLDRLATLPDTCTAVHCDRRMRVPSMRRHARKTAMSRTTPMPESTTMTHSSRRRSSCLAECDRAQRSVRDSSRIDRSPLSRFDDSSMPTTNVSCPAIFSKTPKTNTTSSSSAAAWPG